MVPKTLSARALSRALAGTALSGLLLATPALAGHRHASCPPEAGVGEYESGEVGEYVTEEIPEYITGEIPEYETGEIPEYRPRADGSYISGWFPPKIVGSAYVEVKPGYFVLVHGKSGRAFARHARLIGLFEGDRLVTYETYGFPPYRHFENDQDVRTEHWTYPEYDTTFIFCGDRLIGTTYF